MKCVRNHSRRRLENSTNRQKPELLTNMLVATPYSDTSIRIPVNSDEIAEAFWALEELLAANESLERHMDVFVTSLDEDEEERLRLVQEVEGSLEHFDSEIQAILDEGNSMIWWAEVTDLLQTGFDSLLRHAERVEEEFGTSPFSLFLEEVSGRYYEASEKTTPLSGKADGSFLANYAN